MKKLWNKNRVLFVLTCIVIICVLIMGTVFLISVFSQGGNPYGDRLVDEGNHIITDEIKENIESFFRKDEHLLNFSIDKKVRTIYVHLTFDDKITLDKAKKLVEDSVSTFTENILEYYDISFALKSDNFTIIGNKNVVIDHVSWNNNRIVEEENEKK